MEVIVRTLAALVAGEMDLEAVIGNINFSEVMATLKTYLSYFVEIFAALV